MENYGQTSLNEYYTIGWTSGEENVKIEEEPDTKPSKYNYSIPKDMKKYIFHLVR